MSRVAEMNATRQDSPAAQALLANREQLKRKFAEDGYLVFPGLVAKDKLARLHQQLSQAFDQARTSGKLMSGGGTISGHLNCFPGEAARFAYEAIDNAGIVDLIKVLFPKATQPPNVGCNFNMPHSVAQHYHADRNFLDHFMIANVAVVDTTIQNGAIDMIPGTHKKFYKYWRFALERASKGSTRIEMKQGDVLIRTSNVWHRGMPNFTSAPRPMLAFTWEDGGSKHADRPTTLGRLRERTFVTAPITYHAYRFVSSLADGSKGYDHQ
jgi:hypothetical protein